MRLPQLETERTSIRQFREGDAEAIGSISDPEAIIIDDAASLISVTRSDHYRFLGVWLKSKVLIGCINFHVDASEIKLGFWFVPAMHGQGYAHESISAVLLELSGSYPSKELCAETSKENVRALRLLDRLGFTRTNRKPKTNDGIVLCC